MRMTTLIFSLLILAACGGGSDETKVIGDWKLVSYVEGDNSPHKDRGEPFALTDCDKQSVWSFSAEDAEALSDGTKVKKLKVKAGEGCDAVFYSREGKWTLLGNKLFIDSTNIGGLGGRSNAGKFTVHEVSDRTMKLEIMDSTYSFEKIK